MAVKVDYKKCCWKDWKCIGCGCGSCKGCAEACPVKAIKRGKIIIIDKKKCINCGACIASCKHDAISFE